MIPPHLYYLVGLWPQNYKKIEQKIIKKTMLAHCPYNFKINFSTILSVATILRAVMGSFLLCKSVNIQPYTAVDVNNAKAPRRNVVPL